MNTRKNSSSLPAMLEPFGTRLPKAKKYLGQNFLIDANIVRKIVNACDLNADDTVLEIGPGQGALTARIAPKVKKLVAVEKDRALAGRLQQTVGTLPSVQIVCQDILSFDFESLPVRFKIVGNLPYNISSPIIGKALKHRERISEMFITVQLEFARRLTAAVGSKDFSALGCLLNLYAQSRIVFKIKPSCFHPVPNVDSCFCHIRFRDRPLAKPVCPRTFQQVIHAAFSQRRKRISNALGHAFGKRVVDKILNGLVIEPGLRADHITPVDYVRIADRIFQEFKAGKTAGEGKAGQKRV